MFKFKSKFLITAVNPQAPISQLMGSLYDLKEYFKRNNVFEVKWKDLWKNPQYRSACERCKKILDPIRVTNPNLTPEMIDQALSQIEPPDYQMQKGKPWTRTDVSFRAVEQQVLLINKGAKATALFASDPEVRKWFRLIQQSSSASGHPNGPDVVGWLRVDEVNKDFILVDEVQSDLVNSLTVAMNLLRFTSAEDYEESIRENTVMIEALRNKAGMTPAQYWTNSQQYMRYNGITLEVIEQIRNKLNELFADWAEVGISTLIKIARDEGIGTVLINTEDELKHRDPHFSSEKYTMYYGNIAKKQGFKQITIDTPELSGTFWAKKV